jgi:hypothetical protein
MASDAEDGSFPMLRIVLSTMGLPGFRILKGGPFPELIVVTDDLIPRDRLVEPGCMVRFLIIDGVGPGMSARAGGDNLAIKDIDKPSQFIILSIVDIITQKDTEIKRRFFV